MTEHAGGAPAEQPSAPQGPPPVNNPTDSSKQQAKPSKDNSCEGNGAGSQNRLTQEDRARLMKERQSEDRQKKLQELKQHAAAAQKYREQQEEERRKKIEELRARDQQKLSEVTERRKLIEQTEKYRREAILRKSQERETRLETKRRNERSNIVFAFGSSTPRLLDTPGDVGSFWGSRKATSTSNVVGLYPVTAGRRCSTSEESSKKRATSAHALDRNKDEDLMTKSMSAISSSSGRGRRKTDLIPTVPIREMNKSRTRSPGKAVSMSRLDQLAQPVRRHQLNTPPTPTRKSSSPHDRSMSRSMQQLAGRKKIESDRQVVGLQPLVKGGRGSMSMGNLAAPKQTRSQRLRLKATAGVGASPSRPTSALSQNSQTSAGPATPRMRPSTGPRRPRPISIAGSIPDKSLMQHSKAAPKAERPERKPSATRDTKPKKEDAESKPKKEETRKERPQRKVSAPARTASRATDKPKVPGNNSKSSKTPPLHSPSTEAPKLSRSSPSPKSRSPKTQSPEPKPTASEEAPVKAEKESSVPPEASAEVENVPALEPQPEVSSTPEVIQSPQQEETDSVEVAPAEVAVSQTPVMEDNERQLGGEDSLPKATEESVPVPVESGDSTLNVQTQQEEEKKPETTEVISEAKKEDSKPVSEVGQAQDSEEGVKKHIITTEEEAKARLAEKRRQAREAELERLRLEEEQRQREEEEERRREEEELRLIAEARKAEEERLQKAIEEAAKREEEERRRKAEEQKLKEEREEAERIAREEAEKAKIEAEEKLRKEEEERQARRKRVEAIMSRTRGKGATSTKEEKAGNMLDNGAGGQMSTSGSEKSSPDDDTRDPTQPDLIGDIMDRVQQNGHHHVERKNEINSAHSDSDSNERMTNSITILPAEEQNGDPVKNLNLSSNQNANLVEFESLSMDSSEPPPQSAIVNEDSLNSNLNLIISGKDHNSTQNNVVDLLS